MIFLSTAVLAVLPPSGGKDSAMSRPASVPYKVAWAAQLTGLAGDTVGCFWLVCGVHGV